MCHSVFSFRLILASILVSKSRATFHPVIVNLPSLHPTQQSPASNAAGPSHASTSNSTPVKESKGFFQALSSSMSCWKEKASTPSLTMSSTVTPSATQHDPHVPHILNRSRVIPYNLLMGKHEPRQRYTIGQEDHAECYIQRSGTIPVRSHTVSWKESL
jgi:hypothetical protein